MSSTTSYNNDKVVTGEVEYPATDPASGAFFHTDFKKNEDLKVMLDGSKDSLKLEAMKRIIGMIAKGRDASDLFPAVVKNVVSKNIEVKKLVYVYLVRYAEEQQDLALLSISTFQRALKDPNQLIRASALRVLSSIRVPMIVPIVMLAIRDSASDMSPYVRKTAAHAIPKLYSLDPEQKEELVQVIDRLLSDKAPLVVGSAAMAFSEVCPDRISLLHRSYRKLCALLADVDEWGQLTLLNVLTVYARTCFPDPNKESACSSDSEASSSAAEDGRTRAANVDVDHRLLLRSARPLLQSRNSGVVLAVAQLYVHTAPVQELGPVSKALVRLLRAAVEVQSVVLNCIAALTVTRPALFQPFLKSFFVRNSDPTHIKLLKLEIVSNIANETNAGVVLRELQTYVSGSDSSFSAATVHAIGRLATNVHTHTLPCLTQLLKLLSTKDEVVVCEAVVVVKRVVGGGAVPAAAALQRAHALLRADRLCGAARAAALWLVSEHGASQPVAVAALAHQAAQFPALEEPAKLQTLSLAVKLCSQQPAAAPLARHVAALARYDASYDVRDRARALRRFIDPPQRSKLQLYAREIFCAEKPKPIYTSSFKEREKYTVGTLSQYVGVPASGYRGLPAAPLSPPPSSLRDQPNTEDLPIYKPTAEQQKDKSFYSEPESSDSESSSSSGASSSEESDEEDGNELKKDKNEAANNGRSSKSATSDSSSDSSSSSSEEESSSEESENEPTAKSTSDQQKSNKKSASSEAAAAVSRESPPSNLDLLLQLEHAASTLPTMTPTCPGTSAITPHTPHTQTLQDDSISWSSAALVPGSTVEVIPRVLSRGLQLLVSWPRSPHLFSTTMSALTLTFVNHTADDVTNIRIGKKILSGARSMHEFSPIPVLGGGCSVSTTLGVDFADTIQPVEFTIASNLGAVEARVAPPVGELLRAVCMSPAAFRREQRTLRGLTECHKKSSKLGDEQATCKRVFETANLGAITSTGDTLRFAGITMKSQDLVLLSVKIEEDATTVVTNCQNMAIASLLANEVAQALARG